jgi:hypothetical protein
MLIAKHALHACLVSIVATTSEPCKSSFALLSKRTNERTNERETNRQICQTPATGDQIPMENSTYDEGIEVDLSIEQLHEDAFKSLISDCMDLLFEDNFEELLNALRRDFNHFLPHFPKRFGVLLGAASYRSAVPLEVFSAILSIDPTTALFQDSLNRTPLHMIVMHADRPDMVRVLVEASSECVHVTDLEGLRPIDILTQRILMKEGKKS